MTATRLRQLVFASQEVADIERLRQVLGLGPGFVDPGVAEFGLTNGVFALGDQFLEVVVPVEAQTAAGRFMARSGGRGGYMAIFQTDDLDGVRQRADAAKIRRVWNIDLADISASHLHPADIGAAIVSIDEARPAQSWRWGGPDWGDQAVPGALCGLDVTASDPAALSGRWGDVLALAPQPLGHEIYELSTADGPIRFLPGSHDHLSGYTLRHRRPDDCLKRAQDLGWVCNNTGFQFAGVEIQLKSD